MAMWQNGKLHLYGSTQSYRAARSPASRSGSASPKDQVVLISEFCGGGFGGKIPGSQTMAIPALLKTGRRADAHQPRGRKLHWPRPGRIHMRAGSASERRPNRGDGRVLHRDCGPCQSGRLRHSQVPPRRRCINPRTCGSAASASHEHAAACAQRAPGGEQASTMFEPLVSRPRANWCRSGGDSENQRACDRFEFGPPPRVALAEAWPRCGRRPAPAGAWPGW